MKTSHACLIDPVDRCVHPAHRFELPPPYLCRLRSPSLDSGRRGRCHPPRNGLWATGTPPPQAANSEAALMFLPWSCNLWRGNLSRPSSGSTGGKSEGASACDRRRRYAPGWKALRIFSSSKSLSHCCPCTGKGHCSGPCPGGTCRRHLPAGSTTGSSESAEYGRGPPEGLAAPD